MKIQTECVPCLLKRVLFEIELSTDDKELQNKTIKKACTLLAELYDPNICSVDIATKVHKLVYETLGEKDPYKKLKIESNKAAKKLIPRVEELINVCEDPLRMSMLCSIVGNMMDFGIEGASNSPEKLFDIFEEIVSDDLGYDDYDRIKNILKDAKNVLLFADNCGEIVFDKILCSELKKFKPDIFLTVVVKGESILSDATMDDALEIGLDKEVDQILTTGCFAVGIDFEKLPLDVKKLLDKVDIILSKGMGNYEAFSDTTYRPIAYLLRTKCGAIANSMGVTRNINVIKLYH
ncbi:MAG: ARMT1-like domain-containing protein [Candidatus Thermoplasmatota archaeon]|nr:ARMT1-like domain-containing protein [Candidatus Thermoplasmatota archaeon]